jgi:hypothetical protein
MDSTEKPQSRKPQEGYLASILRPLEIAASTEQFETWVKENTEEELDYLMPGYVLFFETGIRAFAIGASISPVLALEFPYVLQRAEGELIDPDKIPESNERLDFFRNLKQIQQQIRPLTNWASVDGVLDAVEPLLPLSSKLSDSVEPASETDLSKETALEYATRIQLVDRFLNVRQYAPRGYSPTNLGRWLTGGPRENALAGYVRTLQFVWTQILQKSEYEDSVLPELHTATVWEKRYESPSQETALQSFYGDVRGQFLTPIDTRFESLSTGRLVEPDELLHASDDIPRDWFEPLFSSVEPPARSTLEIGEELDYTLFWNDAEWLGSATFSKDATFETTLWGLAITLGRENSDFPIHVAQFKHPANDSEGNRYSYAILQRLAHTGIGDPSGWLVFYEVGTDFSGSEVAVERIEQCIEDVKSLWPIERRELTIELEKFRQLMATRLADDYLQNEAEAQDASAKLDSARGVLLELLGYFALSQQEEESTIYWSIDGGGGEIDLLVETESKYRVIECKADPATIRLEEEVAKLQSKATPLKGDRPTQLEFMFWEEPSSEVEDALASVDIDCSSLSTHPSLNDISVDRLSDVFERTLRDQRFDNPMGPVRRFSGIRKDLFWYLTLLNGSN